MKNIEILVEEEFIVILVDGREKGDILISNIAEIRLGSDKCSHWVIYFAEKTGYNSKQQREELLIPLATLIEKYHPNKIMWFNTFKVVEELLIVHAYENTNTINGIEDESSFDWDIEKILSTEIENEVDNPENHSLIIKYLIYNDLPPYITYQ